MATPLASLLNRAILQSHPVYASIELTYVCNLHCYFCYNPVQRKGQKRTSVPDETSLSNLSVEEIESILDQLADMGVLYLTLTGGEPLIHPHFWKIAQAAKERSFALRIFTNGIAINEKVADRLAELCPNCLEISIHGIDDETAEKLNQVPRSHTKLIKALELLRERNLRVFLKCVVTRLVENQLDEIKAIGDSFDYQVFFDPILTLSDDGQEYPMELIASDAALKRLYSAKGMNIGNSPFERQPDQLNCSIAMGTLHIDPFGNVSPCVQWKKTVGNVRNSSLKQLWETSRELEMIREINRKMGSILKEKTEDHAFCGHCPGLSELRYGDATRPEEQYLRVARIRRELYESENQNPE